MTGIGASGRSLTRRALLGLTSAAIAGFGIGRRAVAADPPAIVAPPGLGGDEGPEIILRIVGDDAAATTIIPGIAENFLRYRGANGIAASNEDQPEGTTQVSGTMLNGKQIGILIHASSSADGFSQLAGGGADIALTTRLPRPNELPGVDKLAPAEAARLMRPIALNAIQLVANKATGITTLTLDQSRAIFAGQIGDWSKVGGNPGPVHRYGRPIDYSMMLGGAAAGETIPPGLLVVQSYEQMLDSVAHDRQAIGFVAASINYHKPRKFGGNMVPIRFRLGQRLTAMPDEYGIATGDYPLVFPILLFRMPGQPSVDVESFFAQAESAESQIIEMKAGLTSVMPQLLVPPLFQDHLPESYRDVIRNALRVSTTVRFEPGSVKVDSRTRRGLDDLGSYLRRLDISPEQLRHVVFSEDTGTPQRNVDISAAIGDVFQTELRARNVRTGKIVPLGAAYPLATSNNPLEQRLNRRVETWVTP